MLKMVVVNGSPGAVSRTGVLVNTVGDAIARAMPVERTTIALAESAADFMCSLSRDHVTINGERALREVESADILVVGTPVYRGSYTGVFKHFFDLIDKDALRGRKAVLCATGGTALHGLMLEHQLRSLMTFFAMHTMPTALFGLNEDFKDGRVMGASMLERIDRVAVELLDVISESRRLLHA